MLTPFGRSVVHTKTADAGELRGASLADSPSTAGRARFVDLGVLAGFLMLVAITHARFVVR